jgi:outer membrane protein assembly factor BamB
MMSYKHFLRVALIVPVLGGCSLFDDWMGSEKVPLPGTRVAVLAANAELKATPGAPRVVLPAPRAGNDWPQAGGTPVHDREHPVLRDGATRAWSTSIGTGGGYRRKITAEPVVAGGRVFTLDSDAVVAGFEAGSGSTLWSTATKGEDDRSTNVGGGVAFDGGVVYVATGRADVLALGEADGKVKWRARLPVPARGAPTVAGGLLFIPLLDNQLVAVSAADGGKVWSYQARTSEPVVLGLPAPAFADGLVVAGFGSGELVALNAQGGALVWTDSLAAARGRNSLADISTIMGRTAIKSGRAFAVSMGQQLAALDLRSGRRLWERDIAAAESPWIAGDWMFVVTTGGQVTAVSLVDGQAAWVTQLETFENPEKKKNPIRWLGPVLAGDRLVVAGSNGQALSLSPYSGQILGKEALAGAASVTPIVAGGTLYIVTDNGALTAYR